MLTDGFLVLVTVQPSEIIQIGGVSVQVVRLLAEGTSAHVLLVRSLATNETFALKRILCRSQNVENDVQMELQVFRVRLHVLYLLVASLIVLTVAMYSAVRQALEHHAAG